MNIRVTKIFHFETAHALWGYDGKCANIHGHSYSLTVTVSGPMISDTKSPKQGMIIDFGDLKDVVRKNVVEHYDHTLLLNGNSPHAEYAAVEKGFSKIELCNFQPTCENMLIDMVSRLKSSLPKQVSLRYARLQETTSSYAEWHDTDNT